MGLSYKSPNLIASQTEGLTVFGVRWQFSKHVHLIWSRHLLRPRCNLYFDSNLDIILPENIVQHRFRHYLGVVILPNIEREPWNAYCPSTCDFLSYFLHILYILLRDGFTHMVTNWSKVGIPSYLMETRWLYVQVWQDIFVCVCFLIASCPCDFCLGERSRIWTWPLFNLAWNRTG